MNYAKFSLPEFLQGRENNILYRLILAQDETVVQSRYVTKRQIKAWLNGENNIWLDWKIKSHVELLKISLRYLKEELESNHSLKQQKSY